VHIGALRGGHAGVPEPHRHVADVDALGGAHAGAKVPEVVPAYVLDAEPSSAGRKCEAQTCPMEIWPSHRRSPRLSPCPPPSARGLQRRALEQVEDGRVGLVPCAVGGSRGRATADRAHGIGQVAVVVAGVLVEHAQRPLDDVLPRAVSDCDGEQALIHAGRRGVTLEDPRVAHWAMPVCAIELRSRSCDPVFWECSARMNVRPGGMLCWTVASMAPPS